MKKNMDNRGDTSVRESVESDNSSALSARPILQNDMSQSKWPQNDLPQNELWSELDCRIEKYWYDLLHYAGELMWTPPVPPPSWFHRLANNAADLFDMKVDDESTQMVVQVFVPHIPEDQVQMYVYRDGLLLAIEESETSELRHDNGSLVQKNTHCTHMRRFIPFTAPVMYDKISSTFDNGCLKITVPKINDDSSV